MFASEVEGDIWHFLQRILHFLQRIKAFGGKFRLVLSVEMSFVVFSPQQIERFLKGGWKELVLKLVTFGIALKVFRVLWLLQI